MGGRGATVISVAVQPALSVAVVCAVLQAVTAAALQISTTGNQAEMAFDVVSVRPEREVRPQHLRMLPGGRFEANVRLRQLIVYAYRLRPHQRVEGFEALLDERFAVVARVADGVTLADGDDRRLVRQLLADRFNLRARFEDRSEPLSMLRRVHPERLGPRLRPSPLDCSVEVPLDRDLDRADPFRRCSNSFFVTGGRVAMVVPSMAAFVAHLSVIEGRAIFDETGLEGPWEIDMTFTPSGTPGVSAELLSRRPPLEVALRNDLGLRLDVVPGIVSHLVVEHVEPPSPD